MDHAVITIDAGVGVHLEHPSTPQPKSSLSIIVSCKEHLNIRKSKEKKAGSGSKDTNKRKCQNTMPIHKKFTDNNIHIHRAAHRLPRKQIRLSRVQGNGGNKVPDLEEHRIGARFRIDPPSGSQSSVQKKELFPSPSTILHPAARQCSAFLSCGNVKDTQWRSG
ncbi:hypothetical protein OsJ_15698 [Oryza sativa Japonica Group]|uniref:Uncharacterized protein n=1 Tax=Oryza sativa subsp. japonica TaxID=39947 RepID=B9FGG8_ORYSJ|nr:hypothetical protein OsJ_15698 [Oryza sativa Japonica Group]